MTRHTPIWRRAILGIALAALAVLPALAQSPDTISKEAKTEVLDRVTQIVTRNAFVPGVDFTKWESFVETQRVEIDEAKDEESFNLAVNKALRNFGFSHIVLMSPKATRARQDRSVVGIGVTIQQEEGGFRVHTVIPDAPAAKGGIEPGDLLTEADGKKLETTGQITGAEGTEVSIKLIKEDGVERTVTLKRSKISTVRPETLSWIGDDTAVLKVTTFDLSYDAKRVDTLMEEAHKAKFLVLDLRSNGGGAVTNMTHLLSLLLPQGTPIGTFITRRTAERFAEETKGDPNDVVAVAKWSTSKLRTNKGKVEPFAGKIAVLVDGGSGSASEISAAALKDHLDVPIVGSKSAGAVLASIMMPLPRGFMLQYPITDYVTLKGLRLEGNGVKPDVEAPSPRFNQADEGVAKAVTVLKGG